MKTNETIETSKRRATAWGDFLVTTFRKLGITDNEVIQNCYVGRSTYYRMKQGELILYPIDGLCRTEDSGTNGKVVASSWFYGGVEKENYEGVGGLRYFC